MKNLMNANRFNITFTLYLLLYAVCSNFSRLSLWVFVVLLLTFRCVQSGTRETRISRGTKESRTTRTTRTSRKTYSPPD